MNSIKAIRFRFLLLILLSAVLSAACQRERTVVLPSPDADKYKSIRDAKDWLNPYLIIQEDGVVLCRSVWQDERKPVSIEELRDLLVKLPKEAWPYGRIVGLQENSLGRKTELTAKNKQETEQILKSLEIKFSWWPTA